VRDKSWNESLQTPEERAQLDQTGTVLLGSGAVNPDFAGPLRTNGWQTRVTPKTENRLETYNKGTQGVYKPLFLLQYGLSDGVAPLDQINN